MDTQPLQIDRLHFAYDKRLVLENVSIELQAGQVVGLIGPNGSGKSTLIKLSSGFFHPREGSIKVFGQPPTSWRQRNLARMLAYVPQAASLPPMFTVWDSTLLGRTPYLGFLGMAREHDRQVTRRALEWVGIAELADRQIGELSGGERQRVVLARALAQEPRCLLLDEPTTHLDIHHQVTILSLVRRLVVEQGVAAMAVLHDLNLAATFADQLVFLSEGRVIAQGPPAEVLSPTLLNDIYGENVTTYPRPDDQKQPAVLPRRVSDNSTAADITRPGELQNS
jgi:iron complex transport system ATP-binding protein